MFETTCTLPLPTDIFAQSIHPSSSLVALGLATGHVQVHRLPAADSTETGQGCITTAWKTRRHKGSCRCLAFSTDGSYLFSAGTDGLLKCAQSEDGRVASKIALPKNESFEIDPPTLLSNPTPQHLLLATDSSALHVYDLRSSPFSGKPSQTYTPHADYISSLTPLPASQTSTSGLPRQCLTTGGATIAVIDLRKGVVLESVDWDEELLCSALVGSKAVVGGERGVLRIWETGNWEEPPQTFHAGREGVEAVCAVPDSLKAGKGGDKVVCGMGNGAIGVVQLAKGKTKVVAELSHDHIDAPASLGFVEAHGADREGRMVSGGGRVIKVWEEITERDATVEKAQEEQSSEDSENEEEEEEEEDSSDEEEKQRKRTKKRRRNQGPDKRGDHGVMAFKGMD